MQRKARTRNYGQASKEIEKNNVTKIKMKLVQMFGEGIVLTQFYTFWKTACLIT